MASWRMARMAKVAVSIAYSPSVPPTQMRPLRGVEIAFSASEASPGP